IASATTKVSYTPKYARKTGRRYRRSSFSSEYEGSGMAPTPLTQADPRIISPVPSQSSPPNLASNIQHERIAFETRVNDPRGATIKTGNTPSATSEPADDPKR
ncbi:hypothetical protein EV182_001412, partial [Spiromyces aspiralis]